MRKLKLTRNHIYYIIVGALITLFFSVSLIRNFDNSSVADEQFQLFMENEVVEVDEEIFSIFVDVKGAVAKPGVYEMEQGTRVVDVIEKAAGFLEDADRDAINLALVLVDEMVIFVPRHGDEQLVDQKISLNASGKINLNVATVEELQQLPGIGPAKAAAIVSYRDDHGKFKTIMDLANVSGIGQKTVGNIADLIEAK